MNKIYYILFFTLSVIMLPGCIESDDAADVYNSVTLANQFPESLVDGSIVSGKVTFKELNTAEVSTYSLPQYSAFMLAEGVYDIEATAAVENAEGRSWTVRSVCSAVTIVSEITIDLSWFYYNSENSLIFSEIYTSGSLNATATSGLRDSYFRIYNNTDQVIYADGLGLAESAFVNARSNTFEILTAANDRQVNFTAGTIWVIPGNGTDHPIQPGKSIKLVDQAINWGEEVSGALNHTDADFEWVDDDARDTDNPSVPNLDKWYCYSLTIWVASNQSNRSYALVRFPDGMTAEQYLAAYHGPYDYIHTIGTQMRNEKAYLIPNEWIIDGVNLSNKEVWVRGALSESIDMSYASISDRNADPDRFGKVFCRKVANTDADGRQVLMDTNDSASDFELLDVKTR